MSDDSKKSKARARHFTEDEVKLLLQLVEDHPDVKVKSNKGTMLASQRQLWLLIAESFAAQDTSLSPTKRPAPDLRKKYSNHIRSSTKGKEPVRTQQEETVVSSYISYPQYDVDSSKSLCNDSVSSEDSQIGSSKSLCNSSVSSEDCEISFDTVSTILDLTEPSPSDESQLSLSIVNSFLGRLPASTNDVIDLTSATECIFNSVIDLSSASTSSNHMPSPTITTLLSASNNPVNHCPSMTDHPPKKRAKMSYTKQILKKTIGEMTEELMLKKIDYTSKKTKNLEEKMVIKMQIATEKLKLLKKKNSEFN